LPRNAALFFVCVQYFVLQSAFSAKKQNPMKWRVKRKRVLRRNVDWQNVEKTYNCCETAGFSWVKQNEPVRMNLSQWMYFECGALLLYLTDGSTCTQRKWRLDLSKDTV
jgi:hypothetical protein